MIQKFQKAEHIYIPVDSRNNTLEDYILNNFQLPDNDLERICEFIQKDYELQTMIYNLKNNVKSEIDEIKAMQMNFYPEFQENELVLEIEVLTNLSIDENINAERKIDTKLFNNYSKTTVDKLSVYITNFFD